MTDKAVSKLPELIKFTDFIAALNVSRTKGDHLVSDPKSDCPRPFKIGNERYFRADDVRAWIARKAERANAPMTQADAA